MIIVLPACQRGPQGVSSGPGSLYLACDDDVPVGAAGDNNRAVDPSGGIWGASRLQNCEWLERVCAYGHEYYRRRESGAPQICLILNSLRKKREIEEC